MMKTLAGATTVTSGFTEDLAREFTIAVPRAYGAMLACRLQREFAVKMIHDVNCDRGTSIVRPARIQDVTEDTCREMTYYAYGFMGALDYILSMGLLA